MFRVERVWMGFETTWVTTNEDMDGAVESSTPGLMVILVRNTIYSVEVQTALVTFVLEYIVQLISISMPMLSVEAWPILQQCINASGLDHKCNPYLPGLKTMLIRETTWVVKSRSVELPPSQQYQWEVWITMIIPWLRASNIRPSVNDKCPVFFGFCRKLVRTKTQQGTDKASENNGVQYLRGLWSCLRANQQ